jgi:hypothetical protein
VISKVSSICSGVKHLPNSLVMAVLRVMGMVRVMMMVMMMVMVQQLMIEQRAESRKQKAESRQQTSDYRSAHSASVKHKRRFL